MQFQTYEKYKPSGIDWLGEIPDGWEVKRLKDVISSNEKSLSNNEDSFFEIKYIDISNVGTDKLNDKPEVFYFQDAPSRARRIPRKNDVILSTVRTYLKAVYFFENIEENTICSTGFSVLTPKRILPRFLKYSVIGENFIDNVIKFSKGVSYPAINDSELTALPLFLPNKQTQTAIADYLDQHTALIDKKIELLKAKKQSYTQLKQTLINEVVTKGLDTTVEMKDSGKEWIGQIPKHWEVKRFKEICYKNQTGGTPSTTKSELFLGNNVWVTIADISEDKFVSDSKLKLTDEAIKEANIPITPKNSLIYSFKLTLGKIAFAQSDLYTNEALISILPNKKIDLNYFYYMLPKFLFLSATENIYGAKMLNQRLIANTLLVVPPKSEQISIANYLDEKTHKIDQIIKKIDTNIFALQEFRKTLINDTVTGKIKVL